MAAQVELQNAMASRGGDFMEQEMPADTGDMPENVEEPDDSLSTAKIFICYSES